MKVFTIAGPKGGCGKSLVTTTLAVRAAQENKKVTMVDLDEGQGTLTEWRAQRARLDDPYLCEDEGTLDQVIDALRAKGWDYVFIDGPPYEQDLIEMSVIVADAVLIPLKLSYFDVKAIDSIIDMCERRKKPYAFIVNEFDSRKKFVNANKVPLAMLEGRGPILQPPISYDPKYRVGQIKGQTGPELDAALAAEIDSLWTEVRKLAAIGPTLRAVQGGRHG